MHIYMYRLNKGFVYNLKVMIKEKFEIDAVVRLEETVYNGCIIPIQWRFS